MDQEKQPTIQISASGKVMVSNAKAVKLLDADGNEIKTRTRFSLCNCGKTNDLPFCDGSHNN